MCWNEVCRNIVDMNYWKTDILIIKALLLWLAGSMRDWKIDMLLFWLAGMMKDWAIDTLLLRLGW